jgi:hypothetical protein
VLLTPLAGDGWIFLEAKGRLELIDRHFELSAQFFGAAWTQRDRDDCFLTEFERSEYETLISELRLALGNEKFEAAFQSGQAMSLKEALTLAVQEFPPLTGS